MSLVEFHPKMVNKSIGDARKELARKDSVYQGLSIFYKVCIYIYSLCYPCYYYCYWELHGITIIYCIVFLISWHFSCIFPDALGKNSKKVSAVISWGECRQLPQPRGMHHSSLQDWWHAGPSGLRRKRTQEGRVDIFWDALQRFFLDVGWLKMGTNGDPLERLELIRSLQNLFIILSLSATFSHFQPLSPQIRCPNFIGSWGIGDFSSMLAAGQDSMYHTKERQQESAEINTSMLGLCLERLDTLQLFHQGRLSCI